MAPALLFLPDGAGDLEILVDEDVMRPTDLDLVDGVRAVAQLQHTVDGPARILGDRGGLDLVRRRSGDDRSRPGMPVLRDLTDDFLILTARLRATRCSEWGRVGAS
jgi:hypothetical protein